MGKFVEKANLDARQYDVLSKNTFNKISRLGEILKFEKINFFGNRIDYEVFYDTQTGLLAKTGILLSKVIEQGSCYLKIQKQSFIPQTFRSKEDVIFIHEISPKDRITDHSIYLMDGISTLFATTFNLDLENILKTVVPKLEITTKSTILKIVSGTGFRANITEQEIEYFNRTTKRKVNKYGLQLENISPITYAKQYSELIALIEKHCKELLLITESNYDYAMRITKKIEPKPKEDKKKKEKILDRIEG